MGQNLMKYENDSYELQKNMQELQSKVIDIDINKNLPIKY